MVLFYEILQLLLILAEADAQRSRYSNQAVGRSEVRIPVGSRYFSLLRNVRTKSAAHAAICSMGTGIITRAQSGWGINLATHLLLLQRLRISGAVRQCPPPLIWLHGGYRETCKIFIDSSTFERIKNCSYSLQQTLSSGSDYYNT